MIRAEIKFKNSAFISALNRCGYRSIADFSRKSGISYYNLIEYANLKTVFKDQETMNKIIEMLDSDEWTLFEQYRQIVEKEHGVKKIVTDIPIDKIISLEDKSLLMLESENYVDESMMHESLKEMVSVYLDTLKIREKEVLKMYFGIGGEPELDLAEIGKKFGISKERTRQIKEKAIRRLRIEDKSGRLRPYLGHEKEI
jgi:RNA polymerase sigma factor (sigma-70 family)